MCSNPPKNLVIMKRNSGDEFKTVVGLEKERESNGLVVSVFSPTIFDKLALFSEVYANEDLILMIMSYGIEVIVPCECQDKFKCVHCTLRSVQCFEPVWDTEVFSVSKTTQSNDCDEMESTNIPFVEPQSKTKHTRLVVSRRIKPVLIGPTTTIQQPEKTVASQHIHPIRSGVWRVDHVWNEYDTSQWRKWRSTLTDRAMEKVKNCKNTCITRMKDSEMKLLGQEVSELIKALYSDEYSVVKPEEKCCFECPACDKKNMKVQTLTMHYRRNHSQHLKELQSKCPFKLLRHVLLKACFPKKKWESLAMGPFFENQHCTCKGKLKKVNFRRCVLQPQRHYHRFKHKKNLTMEDVPEIPALPLLSDNLVTFLFDGYTPYYKLTEGALKHVFETRFMHSIETNSFSASALHTRKRKRACAKTC